MKRKACSAGAVAVLTTIAGAAGVTQALADGEERFSPPPIHFTGLLDDFTTSTVKNGPYVMHGRWSLDLGPRGSATFSADMNMGANDGNPAVVQADPTTRNAHTHHLLMKDGMVSPDPNAWKGCPLPASPVVTGGFVVTGDLYVTGNGNVTPFANPSKLTICVLGVATPTTPGPHVEYANIALIFDPAAPATTHFGTFPIHGVVSRCAAFLELESSDCTLQMQ